MKGSARGHPQTATECGYVLFVVVSGLTFLVLLLVSLATLARVETAIAGATQRQAVARQHARLALDLAVAQLQQQGGPDQRVTAVDHRFFTGVWATTTPTAKEPLAWLVSQGETATIPAECAVELVGVATAGRANEVVVEKLPLRTAGVAGSDAPTTLGHYAYWVGDQGVKASVAAWERPDGPRVQTVLAAGAQAVEFEPRDARNAPLVPQVVTVNQLGALYRPEGTRLGPALLRQNFHAWTTQNLGVLANPVAGGLRGDLSLRPDALGAAFAAWADYPAYMEPAAGGLRRRYRMTPPRVADGWECGVHPVLSHLFLSFNVRTTPPSLSATDGSRALAPVQVRARWSVSLWNPYTSALVPEPLRLEIEGLPESVELLDDTTGTTPATLSLAASGGSPFTLELPWGGGAWTGADVDAWLPGRVYGWVARENKAPATTSYPSIFYTRDLGDAQQGVWRLASPTLVDGDDVCRLRCAQPQTLRVRLYAVRSGEAELLATYVSPEFAGFTTNPHELFRGTYQVNYVLRLRESLDGGWLETAGGDPRASELGGAAFVCVPNGPHPELYDGYDTVSAPDRLLDRVQGSTGRSYNEDVPLFELPRGPLLSVGELQQLPGAGVRPWAVGNAWGSASGANALFDRCFFSGLSGERRTGWDETQPLPSPLLRLLPRLPSGERVTREALLPATGLPSEWSARFLMQGGAFNLNATEATAWAAVLRSTRLGPGQRLAYLDAEAGSGTADETAVATLAAPAAVWARFLQSAPETYKADEPTATSTYAASSTVPPHAPNHISQANTHLFRRGWRALTAAETETLAQAVARRVQAKLADSGPFRSVEEFLAPQTLFGGQSALEAALADAALNAGVAEFSSQWLTPADVMSALAPVLFARSDTFLVRGYGDAANPATGRIEGRAWCEALVQRLPVPFAPADPRHPTEAEYQNPPGSLGRRFQIVQFRWLNRSDL